MTAPRHARRASSKQEAAIQTSLQAIYANDWQKLETLCQQRLRADAKDPVGHKYLGMALRAQGRQAEAFAAWEQALLLFPDDVELLTNFSDLVADQGFSQRAYEMARKAADLAPHIGRVWVNLIRPCYSLGRHQEALEAGEQASKLALTPQESLAMLLNLSSNLRELGRVDEAIAYCREAIRMAPDNPVAYMNLMLFLQSSADSTAMDLHDAALQYARQFEAPVMNQWPSFADRNHDPQRRLRVGFLSPDLREHAVMYFAEGLITHLDRRQFELFAFHLLPTEDTVTRRVRRHVDHFYNFSDLDDGARAARIQALEIDILIDLAGHTAGTGLHTMRFKPAPVQVTWLGFPGTTGLQAMDWRITDRYADQPGADVEYVEKLVRMPDIFCVYRPRSRSPLTRYHPAYAVQPTPALANGFITFGSCNNMSKLTDPVLRTWTRVLAAVPGSRLLIEGNGLANAKATQEFAQRCQGLGLDPERLILVPRDIANQYLTYNRIDIALDPFPLTGGTTSTDLLWMGVPMVTMDGAAFRSRIGVTLLENMGHPEWIAHTEDEYVAIACAFASDLPRLNAQRLQQRERMETSPVMDEARYGAQFGGAMRHMWYFHCAQALHGEDAQARAQALAQWTQHQWPQQPAQITVAQGELMGLPEVYAHLQTLTQTALQQTSRESLATADGNAQHVTHPAWSEVVRWAKYVLEAVPNDPLALATLAEVENAHGHTEFAMTYARYAQQAMQRGAR